METDTLIIAARPLGLRPATLAEIIALRHRILRPGFPPQSAQFPGDADPATWHFGAFLAPPPDAPPASPPAAPACIGCASFMPVPWEGRPAYQLRGMATDTPWQGQGVGRALLRTAERTLLAATPIRQLWCNARLRAVSFYQAQGWQIASDQFDIPTVGPHHRMAKVLG